MIVVPTNEDDKMTTPIISELEPTSVPKLDMLKIDLEPVFAYEYLAIAKFDLNLEEEDDIDLLQFFYPVYEPLIFLLS